MSFTGFLLLAAAVAFSVFIAAKLLPSYLEYYGFSKALDGAARGEGEEGIEALRQRFMRGLDSQYVGEDVVRPGNLQAGDDGRAKLSYERRIHLFFNIDAVLHFEKSVPLRGTGEAQ